jgi:hypothetical protein
MEERSRQVEGFVEEWAQPRSVATPPSSKGRSRTIFVGVGPAGFMLTKEQRLGRFAGGLSYDSFVLDEARARFYGEAAVATGRQKQAGSFRGNDVGGEFRATRVLAEREGRWLLAGWHASPIAGAPSFLEH